MKIIYLWPKYTGTEVWNENRQIVNASDNLTPTFITFSAMSILVW